MIILLQSVTIQFRRLFWYIRITKCDKAILLQSATGCYYKVSQLLQSVTDCRYKVLYSKSTLRSSCLHMFYK